MTRKKFFLFFLIQWLLSAIVKVWLFNNQVFANGGTQQILFWLLTVIIAAAIVRRFGPISLFEAALVGFFWIGIGLLLDLAITTDFTGIGMFSVQAFWDSYGLVAATIFLFHKKKHVYNRHKLHAAKHAAAHAAAHHLPPPQMPDIRH